MDVYPVKAPELRVSGRRILLVDPEGATAKALAAMNVEFSRIASLASLASLSGVPSENRADPRGERPQPVQRGHDGPRSLLSSNEAEG